MVQINPVIIDSAIWNNMIDRGQLKETLGRYYKNGFVPLYTLNNLKEMMNTTSDHLRQKRLIALQQIDYVVKFTDSETPPSSLNLTEMEMRHYLDSESTERHLATLFDEIRSRIEVVSGTDILANLDLHTVLLNRHTNTHSAGRFFASVPSQLYGMGVNQDEVTLRDIDLSALFENREVFNDKMRAILLAKGDKKKLHLVEQSEDLIDQYYNALEKQKDYDNKLEVFAAMAGLEARDISLDLTLRQYLNKMETTKQLKIVSNGIGVDFVHILDIDLKNLPSMFLDRVFRREYQKQIAEDKRRRAEASIIEDRYLSWFSIYFCVIVDKRTGEVLRKLSDRLPFSLSFNVGDLAENG